jgi:hypothetical protein
MSYPHLVSGRVSSKTLEQVNEAIARFKSSEGALVRAAMEDYMPRFLRNQGEPKHEELFSKLATALEENPDLRNKLTRLARIWTRTTRRTRAAAAA